MISLFACTPFCTLCTCNLLLSLGLFLRLCCCLLSSFVGNCFLIRGVVIRVILVIDLFEDAPLPLAQTFDVRTLEVVLLLSGHLHIGFAAFVEGTAKFESCVEVNGFSVALRTDP